jgi:hypothetical protein
MWLEEGLADELLRRQRAEAAARQTLAGDVLAGASCRAQPLSYHLWPPLPDPWRSPAFADARRDAGSAQGARHGGAAIGLTRSRCAVRSLDAKPDPSSESSERRRRAGSKLSRQMHKIFWANFLIKIKYFKSFCLFLFYLTNEKSRLG